MVRVLESQAATLLDHDDSPVGIVTVTRDITERAELERAQTEARLAAEAANRSKSEFLSRMSHELRTPLNAVLGFAQLLEMSQLTADQSEGVTHILRGGRHLLDLINEVLDISRIETGALALSTEPVLLDEVVTATAALVAPLAADHDVIIAVGADLGAQYVLADQQRLRQVLLNLLSNAEGSTTVPARAVSRSGWEPVVGRARVRVTVTRHGPGHPRPTSSTCLLHACSIDLGAEQTAIEGTGIGLALARRLVEAMGGQLGVDTTPGVGSTFWLELPVAEGPMDRYERDYASLGEPDLPRVAGASRRASHGRSHRGQPGQPHLLERIFSQRSETRLIPATEARIGVSS